MRRLRLLAVLLLVAAAVLGLRQALRLAGGGPAAASPHPVPRGDQEVAWFHTSTNAPTWERFVVGAHQAARQLPGLRVDDSAAFLDLTTDVPELVLSRDGCEERL